MDYFNLIRDLSDNDKRQDAIEAFLDAGEAGVLALISALDSTDDNVPLIAAWILGRLGYVDVPFFLSDEEELRLQHKAFDQLKRAGDTGALDALRAEGWHIVVRKPKYMFGIYEHYLQEIEGITPYKGIRVTIRLELQSLSDAIAL